MKRAFIATVIFGLVGLFVGPVVGMLIAEQLSGSTSDMGVKEDGFVGFLYGLYFGPPVGAALGLAIALGSRSGKDPHSGK